MLPARVRANSRLFVVLALVLSAVLLAAAAVAFVAAGDDRGTTRASSPVLPDSTPSPTPTPTDVPTDAPSATPTAAPAESTPATVAPPATPEASATASPTGPVSYDYPRPTRGYEQLYLSATNTPGGGYEQTTFALSLRSTDGDGEIYFDGLTWGDGTGVAAQGSPQRCASYPPLTSPPPPYSPEPDAATFSYRHRYPAVGTYTITVQVASVSKDCKPHGPRAESRKVELQVVVSPSASPSASPS